MTSELTPMMKRFKTLTPFVFDYPEKDVDESESEAFVDQWAEIKGDYPCPSLYPGDVMGVVGHNARAIANSTNIPDIKIARAQDVPKELIQAYMERNDDHRSYQQWFVEVLNDLDTVLVALDRNRAGGDGILGILGAHVGDLEKIPFVEASSNGAPAMMNIFLEFVHVSQKHRGMGIGPLLGGALGYNLGFSLCESLTEYPSVLNELSEINFDIAFEAETAAGARVGSALRDGLSFMMCPETVIFDVMDNDESLSYDQRIKQFPLLSFELVNEY